jgi:hypothetical protein
MNRFGIRGVLLRCSSVRGGCCGVLGEFIELVVFLGYEFVSVFHKLTEQFSP